MARAISEATMNKGKNEARKAILKNAQKITMDDCALYISLYASKEEYEEFFDKLDEAKFMTAKKYFLEKYFNKEEIRKSERAKRIEAIKKKNDPATYKYEKKEDKGQKSE